MIKRLDSTLVLMKSKMIFLCLSIRTKDVRGLQMLRVRRLKMKNAKAQLVDEKFRFVSKNSNKMAGNSKF